MDKVEKICGRLRWKERLWFSKNAKFKSYLLKNNEDIYSPSKLRNFTDICIVGTHTMQMSVNIRNFAESSLA